MPETKHFTFPSLTALLSFGAALWLAPTALSGCGEDAASNSTPAQTTASATGVPSSMGIPAMGAETIGAGAGGTMVGAGADGMSMAGPASTDTSAVGAGGDTAADTATTDSTAPMTDTVGANGSIAEGTGVTDDTGTVVLSPDTASDTTAGSALSDDVASADNAMSADGLGTDSAALDDALPTDDGSVTDDAALDDAMATDDVPTTDDAADLTSTDDMMSMDDTAAVDDAISADDVGADDAASPDDATVDEGPVFHIFMLMGQSNMVGEATAQASDQNDDERLMVLGGCNKPPMQWNLANPPLHDCNPNPIGPGDWFGKTMLTKLPEGHTIGLVPTAVRGESINTFISGGSHHQSILDKIEYAKNSENARFSGIIFHQGETDTGQSWWVDRVVQLYDEVKAAFGVDYDVPFIAGELPADPGNCCSSHNPLVNQLPGALPMGFVVSQEGTQRMDQYHFDHESVVLMGTRYGETMLEALGW